MLQHTSPPVAESPSETTLMAKYAKQCITATPFQEAIARDDQPTVKKVHVSSPKEALSPSKQLPTQLTFHQKKEVNLYASSNCEFAEVESTIAQFDLDDDFSSCEAFETQSMEGCSIPSELGTNGSEQWSQAPDSDCLSGIEVNEQLTGQEFDREELEHFMNANLMSLLSVGETQEEQTGYSLSFVKPSDDAQNVTLPHANLEDENSLVVEEVEIQIEEQTDFGLPQLMQHVGPQTTTLMDPPCWEDLKKPLVDLLLKYYNGEDQGQEFVNALGQVIRILSQWRLQGPINTQSLLNFVIDKVLAVITEVKQKLLYKAIERYELLNSQMRPESDGAPGAPDSATPAGEHPHYIKQYSDCPMAFDQMIISLTQYFELCNLNSYKLEDLWLNLLVDVLCLDRPNKYTVFKAVHHQGFRNIVLKDPLIQQIIREVEEYKDSGLAHMNPRKHLEELYDIRRNCHSTEESYLHLEEQGLRSESLRQLIDFLHDEVAEELLNFKISSAGLATSSISDSGQAVYGNIHKVHDDEEFLISSDVEITSE